MIANVLDFNRYNQKWYETADGFIYAPYVQPVKNLPNEPLASLPLDNEGRPGGMWVEITVPKVDFELTRPWDQASSWIRDSNGLVKLYYSQIYWASDIRQKDGRTEYLLSENTALCLILIGLTRVPADQLRRMRSRKFILKWVIKRS